jgi:hypothetical protein
MAAEVALCSETLLCDMLPARAMQTPDMLRGLATSLVHIVKQNLTEIKRCFH